MKMFAQFFRKDLSVGDVHVSSTTGETPPKKKKGKKATLFDAAMVSQSTKLPVTGMTAAAMAESGQGGPQATDKVGYGVGSGRRGGDASWTVPFAVMKTDPDQRLVFGWASIIERDGMAIIDKQGDIIPADELEKAAYDFVLYSREQDDLHDGAPAGRCVESMVFTLEKQQALGINLGKVGWWVGFKVDNDDLWAAHKRGERPEFSIGGSAYRQQVGIT